MRQPPPSFGTTAKAEYIEGMARLDGRFVIILDTARVLSIEEMAAVKAVLEPFFAPVIENDLVLLRTAAEGDTVFTERLDRHRIESGWVELPVTGVFVFREGKIAVWREYFDMATLLRQWPELAASLN